MPYQTGLSAVDLQLFLLDLADNHEFRRTVQIWTRDHELVEDVSAIQCTGQVDVDTSREVARGALADLYDPTRAVGFDTKSESVGSVSPKFMLHTSVGIRGQHLDRWVDIPTFTGPIGRPNRDGDVLKLEAQGKEALSTSNLYEPYTVKKGTNKIDAIRDIMTKRAGEQFFQLEPSTATMKADVAFGRDRSAWSAVKEIADSMGRRLFYNADGYLVCRAPSTTPVFDFRTGPGGMVIGEPQIGYGEDYYTGVIATGGTPKGAKSPITAVAFPPVNHPLSPQSMARGGYPDYRMYEATDDTITKRADLQTFANNTLTQVLLEVIGSAFDAMLNPLLEDDDAIRHIDHLTGVETVSTAARFVLPLQSDVVCPVGYNKRVTRSVRPAKNVA